MLDVHDLGAGSKKKSHSKKTICEIARNVVSDQKFGRLLFRLANFYRARVIMELGSSVGISTAYLASADAASRVVTMEGSPAIARVAQETFQKLKLRNITQSTGSFETILSEQIERNAPSDLVFIDGNHRKIPVLEYFEKFLNKISDSSLVIIHDIHWSREMEEAWQIIQGDPRVKMSIDIFSAGLIFFRNEFKVKQQFVIRF